MTEHKDVIIAVLGAAAVLAGLILVFLGFLITTYQGFDGDTPNSVLRKYRVSAWMTVAVFGLSLVVVGLATWWLVLVHPADSFYITVVAAFVSLLALLLGLAPFAVYRLLD